jgi:hypothetical protein
MPSQTSLAKLRAFVVCGAQTAANEARRFVDTAGNGYA